MGDHYTHIVRNESGQWLYVGFEIDCGIRARMLNEEFPGQHYWVELR